MRLSDFDYTLPPDLIAQQPASPRDASRLLVLDRATGRIDHRVFREIGEYLRSGDVLVINDTRVIPARLRGRRAGTGGRVDLLVVRPRDDDVWEALVRPGRRLKPGTVVEVGAQGIPLEIGERTGDGRRVVRLLRGGSMFDLLQTTGEMPLPPYIRRPVDSPDQYQTVYARADGSIAAPTAGLHFTNDLLDHLRSRGIAIVPITLHVGAGTFQPVVTEDVRLHHLEAEHYTITPEAAEAINRRTGRLVAVGTTTVRALETAVEADGHLPAASGWTGLFIVPGFQFRAVQALVTNFHLPRSTLLMLVSAFAGRERIMAAYTEAIRTRYRFYSFGDAMLIL